MEVKAQDRILFTENKGQVVDANGQPRPDILYTAEANGARLYFTRRGVSYIFTDAHPASHRENSLSLSSTLPQPPTITNGYRMDMIFLGSNLETSILAESAAKEYVNYYLSHCPDGIVGVKKYARLVYRNIYPNIDLIFYGVEKGLKYDFVVHPGGSASGIHFMYKGGDVLLTNEGSLQVHTPLGSVEEHIPLTFQQGGEQIKIISRYSVTNDIVSFDIGDYDKTKSLIIDPKIQWATYVGGSGDETVTSGWCNDITVDKDNNILVFGATTSVDFPISIGAYQATKSANKDVFIMKFSNDGSRLWSTYYGGNSDEDPGGNIITDSKGDIVLAGRTLSTDFPVTATAFQKNYAGESDAFVVKLRSDGSRLWATYYGGSLLDRSSALTVDKKDNILLMGQTASLDLPVSANAFQKDFAGELDNFFAKLDPNGKRIWATYYGGSRQEDYTGGIAADITGHIVVVGSTSSGNFPITKNAFQSTYGGGLWDIYIMRLDSNGMVEWSTFLGGNGVDEGNGVTIDGNGNIFLVGNSSSSDFPSSPNAYQKQQAGPVYDAIIARFNSSGERVWATYYGGKEPDLANRVRIDDAGNILVVGFAGSDFPVTQDALQKNYGGGQSDAFVLKMSPIGERLWSTYYGGSGFDNGQGIALDTNMQIVFCGHTESRDLYTTPNAFQKNFGGGDYDVFVVKLGTCNAPPPVITTNDPLSVCQGDSVRLAAEAGYDSYHWNTGETTPTIIVKQSGVYSVTVYTSSGCKGISKAVNVTVFLRPNVHITGTTSLCKEGDSTTLDAGTGYSSYQWSNGATTSTIMVKEPGIYSVIVRDINGCTSASQAIIVTTGSIVAPHIIANKTDFCKGDSVILDAGPGYDSYQWSNGATQQKITVKESGSYRVTVTSSHGCTSASQIVDVQVVEPVPLLLLSTLDNGNLVIDSGATDTWHCRNLMIQNPSSSSWTITGIHLARNIEFSIPQHQLPLTIVPGGDTAITVCYVPSAIRTQYDTLEIEGQCARLVIPMISSGTADDFVGGSRCAATIQLTTKGSKGGMIKIMEPYPNPGTDVVTIPVQSIVDHTEIGAKAQCKLLSIFGENVAEGAYTSMFSREDGEMVSEAGVWNLDVHELPQGVYFIVVHTSDRTTTFPIVIRK